MRSADTSIKGERPLRCALAVLVLLPHPQQARSRAPKSAEGRTGPSRFVKVAIIAQVVDLTQW